jgi:putative peptide zinc metalloprotease protein
MGLRRRIMFVAYAVASWLYRWVITFSILYFLAMFLKPYKLGAISGMLAVAAVGSMIGWPLYRFFDYLRKRGRLPDMKPERVRRTAIGAAVLLAMFFFLPLPVGRIRDMGLVQLQPLAVRRVFVPSNGGILEELKVRNGQYVQKGEIIARLRNPYLENELNDARSFTELSGVRVEALQEQARKTTDPSDRGKIALEIARFEGERAQHIARIADLRVLMNELDLKAPQAGIVLGLPSSDDVGKFFELQPETPFCTIGDPQRLRVLLPVSTADFDLLRDDLRVRRQAGSDLDVTIRIQGRGAGRWQGRITLMPESEAKEVPPALTTKYGGPLAFTQGATPSSFVPISQHYLVGIDIIDPDGAMCPGTLAQVKVHLRWRSCFWWCRRAISSTFGLGW